MQEYTDPETGEVVEYDNDTTTEQLVTQVTVTLPYKADLMVAFSCGMDMPNLERRWRFNLRQDGVPITGKVGGAFLDTVYLRTPRSGMPAGTYTFQAYFTGQNSGVYISASVLTVEASYNYGKALS